MVVVVVAEPHTRRRGGRGGRSASRALRRTRSASSGEARKTRSWSANRTGLQPPGHSMLHRGCCSPLMLHSHVPLQFILSDARSSTSCCTSVSGMPLAFCGVVVPVVTRSASSGEINYRRHDRGRLASNRRSDWQPEDGVEGPETDQGRKVRYVRHGSGRLTAFNRCWTDLQPGNGAHWSLPVTGALPSCVEGPFYRTAACVPPPHALRLQGRGNLRMAPSDHCLCPMCALMRLRF